jgi:hypothetical protein
MSCVGVQHLRISMAAHVHNQELEQEVKLVKFGNFSQHEYTVHPLR